MFHQLSRLFTNDNRNRGIMRLNFNEAALLWESVLMTDGDILEIGRLHGGSTVLLLHGAGPRRRVVSIDINPRSIDVLEKYIQSENAQDRVELIVGDSGKIKTGAVGMLFIDGDHTYEGCAADVLCHWPQLVSTGDKPALAVFHDAVPNGGLKHEDVNNLNYYPGVAEVCDKLINSGAARLVKTAGSVMVLEKIGELEPGLLSGSSK